MSIRHPAHIPDLAKVVVRRTSSLLDEDMARNLDAVTEKVGGKRVLVVGGAGTIGSATVAQLAGLRPSQLHVVDTDENGLTELVRDLRNRDLVGRGTDLRTTPVDAGSQTMLRILRENGGYDIVLNFAAVKHVRSEKDVFSLLRMLDVNVRLPRRLLEWTGQDCERYFAVSTDKAASPVNLMGASKRVMEHVILDQPFGPAVTSARFANVAFSQGSLLDGWLRRLAKGQAWAVPRGTRRYFVTPQESGELCLLAATLGPPGHIVIPDLDPKSQLRDLVDVAQDVLAALGLRAVFFEEEAQARQAARHHGEGEWPVLLTPLDTVGEKEYEEFVGEGDVVHDCGFTALRSIQAPAAAGADVTLLLEELSLVLDDADRFVDQAAVTELVHRLVPELRHRAGGRSLDDRM